MFRSTPLLPLIALTILLLLPSIHAQFGQMFDHMFQQQQHHQHQGSGHGNKGWQILEEASCWNGYVCPGTASCVLTPKDCPCPYPEDYKCILPTPQHSTSFLNKLKSALPHQAAEDETYVCIRAGGGRTVEMECERVRGMAGEI